MFSSYALGPRGVRSTLVILGVAHATASAPRRISPATRSPAIMSASLSDEYEAGQDGRYPTLASHIRTSGTRLGTQELRSTLERAASWAAPTVHSPWAHAEVRARVKFACT